MSILDSIAMMQINYTINVSFQHTNDSLLQDIGEDINGSLTNRNFEYRLYRLLYQPHQMITLLLSIIAMVFNMVSLCVLVQIRNRITTHFRFIISLALSDIVIVVSCWLFRFFPFLCANAVSFSVFTMHKLLICCSNYFAVDLFYFLLLHLIWHMQQIQTFGKNKTISKLR